MKIGLTQRVLLHKGQAYDSTEHGWYSYLRGHTLVPVPNRLDQDFEELATDLGVLIITGGDDSALRRTVELKIAGQMTLRKKPVVGVCHGAFLLADILNSEIGEVEDHANIEHSVNYFGDVITVNSYHNLAIKKLHRTGTVLATDSAGNIEAWIDGTVAGIVWHPERMKEPWVPDEIKNLIFKL